MGSGSVDSGRIEKVEAWVVTCVGVASVRVWEASVVIGARGWRGVGAVRAGPVGFEGEKW